MKTSENGQNINTPWTAYTVSAPREWVVAQPISHDFTVEEGLRIPLRDGVELVALLWRPKTADPFPVLVERGPHRMTERTGPAGEYYAARGIGVLSVALRGCSGSGGEFSNPELGSPVGDGYDTIEWVAAQPWCSGQVGMICGSISGYTAYQTGVEAPPHLRALLVREGPTSFSFSPAASKPLFALQAVAVSWVDQQLEHFPPALHNQAQQLVEQWRGELHAAQQAANPERPFLPWTRMLEYLPVSPHQMFEGVADYYNNWLAAPERQIVSAATDVTARSDQVRVPICHLGGWFDSLLPHTLSAFTAMKNRAATPAARAGQRLLVGPWVHGPLATRNNPVGLLEFGPNAELDFMAFRMRWYAAHFSERQPSATDASTQAPVTQDPIVWLYLCGADIWLGFDSWPPPHRPTGWYLNTDTLDPTPPATAQAPDVYTYDPNAPVPSLAGGGAMNAGRDQRPIEERLLTYTSAPLPTPLTLLGPLKMVLYAASSAPDTDWIVRLTMVRPDGASIILSGGGLRARYRDPGGEAALLQPDDPERFEIEMQPISMVIPAGYRLRVTVTSSDFPAYARNLNTGGELGQERVGQVAVNRIYHEAALPSHIVLPVLATEF